MFFLEMKEKKNQDFSSLFGIVTLIILTFLENIVCKEKPRVAKSALTRPRISNEISVTVATQTPPIIGSKDKYTWNIKNNI